MAALALLLGLAIPVAVLVALFRLGLALGRLIVRLLTGR